MDIATTRTGLTYEEARLEMGRGRSVRRADWWASIHFKNGRTEWNLSPDTLCRCNDDRSDDPTYRPGPEDENADDWQVVA